MFDGQDEYTQAIQNARFNTYSLKNRVNVRFFLLNLFLFIFLVIIGYLGFKHFEKHGTETKKTTVMGVTYMNPDYKMKNNDLMEMINELEDEVTTLKQEVGIKKVMDNLGDSSEKNNQSLREIFIQHGDTLESLSEEFYGNPMEFNKIINANSSLSGASYTLDVGQKIYIPY